MATVFLNEQELDEAIQAGRFCLVLDSSAVPPHFADQQYQLIDSLEKLLYKKYGEERAFVSDNIWPAYALKTEVTREIFNRDLILLWRDFLQHHARLYCIGTAVYDTLNLGSTGAGKAYLGRVLLNLREIAVESTLEPVWHSQVGDMDST